MIKHGIDTVTDASQIGPTWQSSLQWTSVALTEFFLFELQKDEAGERPFCSTLEGKIAWVPNKRNAAEFASDLAGN